MSKNFIISYFTNVNPSTLADLKLIASISYISGYNLDTEFSPKRLNKNIYKYRLGNSLEKLRLIIVDSTTKEKEESTFTNMVITRMSYESFFSKDDFMRPRFGLPSWGHTVLEETFVIFVNKNWEEIVELFKNANITIESVEPSQPKSGHVLSVVHFFLAQFLLAFRDGRFRASDLDLGVYQAHNRDWIGETEATWKIIDDYRNNRISSIL